VSDPSFHAGVCVCVCVCVCQSAWRYLPYLATTTPGSNLVKLRPGRRSLEELVGLLQKEPTFNHCLWEETQMLVVAQFRTVARRFYQELDQHIPPHNLNPQNKDRDPRASEGTIFRAPLATRMIVEAYVKNETQKTPCEGLGKPIGKETRLALAAVQAHEVTIETRLHLGDQFEWTDKKLLQYYGDGELVGYCTCKACGVTVPMDKLSEIATFVRKGGLYVFDDPKYEHLEPLRRHYKTRVDALITDRDIQAAKSTIDQKTDEVVKEQQEQEQKQEQQEQEQEQEQEQTIDDDASDDDDVMGDLCTPGGDKHDDTTSTDMLLDEVRSLLQPQNDEALKTIVFRQIKTGAFPACKSLRYVMHRVLQRHPKRV